MKPKTAIQLMLYLIGAVLLFHLTILTKVIPYEVTWGGRLKNDAEMYGFEVISIMINIFLGLVIMIKGERIPAFMPMKVVNIILWAFLILFSLNTIGNIFAKTLIEKSLAIVTLFFSYLIFTILKNIRNEHTTKPKLQ